MSIFNSAFVPLLDLCFKMLKSGLLSSVLLKLNAAVSMLTNWHIVLVSTTGGDGDPVKDHHCELELVGTRVVLASAKSSSVLGKVSSEVQESEQEESVGESKKNKCFKHSNDDSDMKVKL